MARTKAGSAKAGEISGNTSTPAPLAPSAPPTDSTTPASANTAGAAGLANDPPATSTDDTVAPRWIEIDSRPIVLPQLPPSLTVGLSAKQVAFVYEWLRDRDTRKAMIRAGYTENTASVEHSKQLDIPGVKECAAWLLEQIALVDDPPAAWIKSRLVAIVNTCMAAEPVLDRKGKPTGYYKIDSAGALKALELLGKEQGMFKQAIQHNHSGSIIHLLQAVAQRGKPSLEQRQQIRQLQLAAPNPDAPQQTDREPHVV